MTGSISNKFEVLGTTYIQPEKFAVRALDLGEKGGMLELVYGYGLAPESPDNFAPAPDQLQAHLAKFTDSESYPKGKLYRRPKPGKGETALSIDAQQSTLIVITLPRKSSLQFNSVGAPISASKEYASRFNAVGKITSAGELVYSHEIEPEDPAQATRVDDCKAAFFVTEAAPEDGFYFNIHLEIVGRLDDQIYRTAIIIDPDVRYPGGTQTVPPPPPAPPE